MVSCTVWETYAGSLVLQTLRKQLRNEQVGDEVVIYWDSSSRRSFCASTYLEVEATDEIRLQIGFCREETVIGFSTVFTVHCNEHSRQLSNIEMSVGH